MTGFNERLAARDRLIGMWVASASPIVAEICAGSSLDFLLLDAEHAPNDVPSLQAQLQAVAPYPITPVLRPPMGDATLIKQYLDIGATALLIPMVSSAEQATELVRATRYPPAGIRGVGSAFARAARWGRAAGYLDTADGGITLLVQVETAIALDQIEAIAGVDGVDGIFVGPADLAASMGHLGQADHPEVVDRVTDAIQRIVAAGTPAGVNAFAEDTARRYLDAGASFVLVGADVTILARESTALADRYRTP
ncbi:MAG TPA: aldolase/citrate lyase family protein [Acidimicrobiales bacterium]|nr:aldolase/citrate lyase family protein [Acidimicrobiales bacterium]